MSEQPEALSQDDLAAVEKMKNSFQIIRAELANVIVGMDPVIEELLISIFSRGHCILEGVPGLAKTLLISTLARSLSLSFNRIQFTPDLMPSDITGTDVIQEDKATGRREFRFLRGPIFANIILADEINRTPPKTQAALLEAMQERQVTIGGERHPLDPPFFVLATQNPIEQEGTYPLPEAQVDRFMFKLNVTYPNRDDEREIVERMAKSSPALDVSPVISPGDIMTLRTKVDNIFMDDKITEYILDIVDATRRPDNYGMEISDLIRYGASPRATIFLVVASKAHAMLAGRDYVTPQDVKDIGMDVLRHRVIITYEAEAEDKSSEDIVQQIFDTVEVP